MDPDGTSWQLAYFLDLFTFRPSLLLGSARETWFSRSNEIARQAPVLDELMIQRCRQPCLPLPAARPRSGASCSTGPGTITCKRDTSSTWNTSCSSSLDETQRSIRDYERSISTNRYKWLKRRARVSRGLNCLIHCPPPAETNPETVIDWLQIGFFSSGGLLY